MLRTAPCILLFMMLTIQSNAQSVPLHQELYEAYPSFQEPTIKDRRFKHADIVPLIRSLKAPFEVKTVGQSIEGRDIFLVKVGTGETRVLLWSQMHGNEPTATMAIMDLFRFFGQREEFASLIDRLLRDLTIYFIPMLNPDGAEKFVRRNALGVDLNRDALRLQSPEAKILKHVRDSLEAGWGFNLHDQGTYYAAGDHPKQASISLLAPAFNEARDINPGREDALKLIVRMNEVLQQFIPGKVGRYSDEFEPRAFGDNIQKWGTRTILIESGGLNGDPEKQELRRLNFVILLTAFHSIASASYRMMKLEAYEKIPRNNSMAFHDLILRKVKIEKHGQPFLVDIAFRRGEIPLAGNNDFYYRGIISELGDLSIYFGHEELEMTGLEVSPGKTYPKTLKNLIKLKKLSIKDLLKEGYTSVRLKKLPPPKEMDDLPIQLLAKKQMQHTEIAIGYNPPLLIKRNSVLRYVVVNGFLYAVEEIP